MAQLLPFHRHPDTIGTRRGQALFTEEKQGVNELRGTEAAAPVDTLWTPLIHQILIRVSVDPPMGVANLCMSRDQPCAIGYLATNWHLPSHAP